MSIIKYSCKNDDPNEYTPKRDPESRP